MALDDRLDLYEVKTQFERFTEWLDLGAIVSDLGFLRRARRTLLPLPLIDRREPIDPSVHLPPKRSRPVAALEGKRLALVASGGGGAAVALAGIKRAFEEAEVEPAEIIGCSGGAIWGSMWAAGMSSDEMAEFSLSWRPEDYLDIKWLGLPRFALSALRGFTGLAKGEAIERLFDSRLAAMACGDTPIPITTIVYNMDLGRVEYFGSTRTPEVTIGHLVRVAIALPLFIESVSVRGHLYVDGGIIENWPAQPVIEAGDRFDHVIGVNLMLPRGFEPRDISGWPGRTGGLLEASRQLQQGYHLELARRARDELGEKLTLIEPVADRETRGVSFYDLFLDRTQWPRLIRQGYEAATRVLQGFA
ncbi:MAG: patatin-like phospholipase family protein [Solirubrobacterales bacterium]|nr:patatin-like phospholipase family protein [Solirubrobacterales bacterium]